MISRSAGIYSVVYLYDLKTKNYDYVGKHLVLSATSCSIEFPWNVSWKRLVPVSSLRSSRSQTGWKALFHCRTYFPAENSDVVRGMRKAAGAHFYPKLLILLVKPYNFKCYLIVETQSLVALETAFPRFGFCSWVGFSTTLNVGHVAWKIRMLLFMHCVIHSVT